MTPDHIEQLKELRRTTLLIAALNGLPKSMQLARTRCLIYFHCKAFGNYRRRERAANGEALQNVRVTTGGVYDEPRLGFPSPGKVRRAILIVRTTCPEETNAYDKACSELREATRRYEACRTRDNFSWYCRGWPRRNFKKNHLALAFRSWAEKALGPQKVFTSGYYKYRYNELLPRKRERKRARREMREAVKKLNRLREAIFAKMGVPEPFRRLI